MVRRPVFQSRRANSGMVLPGSCNRDGDCAARPRSRRCRIGRVSLPCTLHRPLDPLWHGQKRWGKHFLSGRSTSESYHPPGPRCTTVPKRIAGGIPGNLDRAVPDAGQGDPSCVTWVRWCRRGFNGGVGDSYIQRVGGDEAIIDGQRECNCGVHIDCRSGEGCDKL